MDIKAAIAQLMQAKDLSGESMIEVMRAIMSGVTTDAQNAAFLVALQIKGASVEEVFGGATVMRELATKVPIDDREFLVDTAVQAAAGLINLMSRPPLRSLPPARARALRNTAIAVPRVKAVVRMS